MNSNLIENTWKVDKLIVNDENKTSAYSDVLMRFTEDGFIRLEGNETITGSWKVSKQDEDRDPLDSYLEFAISLPHPLNDLANFWTVFAQEDDKYELFFDDGLVRKELILIKK